MLIEFAIALPLLILVFYGLGNVAVKIFALGRIQLADYVLEDEARYVMQRITASARAAKNIECDNDSNLIKIIFHDEEEPRFFLRYKADGRPNYDLYTVHKNDTYPRNPITGNNSFGDTTINYLHSEVDTAKKILRIEFELQSLVDNHKIKITTAIYVPGLEKTQ